MKEIKCTIIQDVLPLYIDEVVSQDTKEMVDEHLQHCEEYAFPLSDSERIDAIYYADFDVEKITARKDSWDSVLERAVLIWEKE
ncbi:zf-HC2 domain-containing protein [Bacillus solimangrovi]|uniref:Putative zinc-finger domain-containing protein n=1 Tax=Bacillus solimangrovi TaxID=1305675 RepID=A0A1E5LAM3_9BACI|nr:zf-HC2 domain-containing protein [Bacillus solimangrovi]OEH91146.1 hypothetical protein BFG57_07190 [Bacillus solimangrovi]